MTRLLTPIVATGLGLAAAGYLLSDAHVSPQALDGAPNSGRVVTIAVLPDPSALEETDTELAPSLPSAPPLPDMAPKDPIQLASLTTGSLPPPDSGAIRLAARPSAMLAGPSASAPMLFGLPAGRPLGVIGHEGGFAKIVDLKSGARGWIEETALASRMRTASIDAGDKPAKRTKQAAATTKPPAPTKPMVETPKDRGVSGSVQPASDSGGTNFAAFVRRGFGQN